MRLGLAFKAFFAILFKKPIPMEILSLDSALAIEAPDAGPTEPPKLSAALQPSLEPPEPPTERPSKSPKAPPNDAVAVQVLAVLQSGGRLLDFLSEDIEGYSDSDIGAAVRDVHRGLKKALSDHFPVEPVRGEEEESLITVGEGFNPSEIRLVGNVVGEPPFSGTLKHKGWKVGKVSLPRIPEGDAAKIVAPAEVEL